MAHTEPRIDEYISKAAPFAQPILTHLRKLIHKACSTVHETIKWSFPNFMYNKAILCSMASFKQHCSFGFWHASLLKDPHNILVFGERSAMGHLGAIRSLADLPKDDILIAYLQEAMQLIDKGTKPPKKDKPAVPQPLEIPDYLQEALEANTLANTHFYSFSPSQKKEYVQWITEAKTDATRNKRMTTAIEWLQEGKTRNWKYEKC
jgi:uncharacterized protein YdeI (YjbR/CyaY-like superfamily)